MANFLIVDDNKTTTNSLCALVKRRGHEALAAYEATEALRALETRPVDVVVTDLKMPGMDGMGLLKRIREHWPEVIVIVITAHGSVETAVEAMKSGAFDFLTKPLDNDELQVKFQKAVAQRELALQMERLSARIESLEAEDTYRHGMGELIGNSPPMQAVFSTIKKVAPTDSTVMIRGESGTGKELVARAIHQQSPRAAGPFIKVHCAAYAPGVLESELFGHERGAFTGAESRKLGRFELADKGTFFLDEVGDIPLDTQIKLLRVLQEREFERVGGTKTIKVDIRLVASTHRDLSQAIKLGVFREDLFYRLNVFSLYLPPLRERREDIPRLVEAFLERESRRLGHSNPGISSGALAALSEYHWPGNVRELQNVIEQIAVFAGGKEIQVAHLTPLLSPPAPVSSVSLPGEDVNFDQELDNFERRLILHAYEQSGRVKAKAAKMLGIDRNRLRYKLEKYGIND